MAAISNPSTHQGQVLGLFGTLEPWEMQQIDHVDLFITHLCLALQCHHDCPHQFHRLREHLHRLVAFLRTHPDLTTRAVRDLAAGDEKLEQQGCARVYDQWVSPYQLTPLRFSWQAHRALGFPDPARDRRYWGELAVVPYVGDGLELAPYGWWDALRGRDVRGGAVLSSGVLERGKRRPATTPVPFL